MKISTKTACIGALVLTAVFSTFQASAGNLSGAAPAGANDFHILLANPILPIGGGYGSSPFGHPNYDPSGPALPTIDYSGSPVAAGTVFSLDDWNLTFLAGVAPPPGSLQVLKTWWTIDGVAQIEGARDYTGGSVLVVLQPVPEPQSYLMLLAGLGALGFAFRGRPSVGREVAAGPTGL